MTTAGTAGSPSATQQARDDLARIVEGELLHQIRLCRWANLSIRLFATQPTNSSPHRANDFCENAFDINERSLPGSVVHAEGAFANGPKAAMTTAEETFRCRAASADILVAIHDERDSDSWRAPGRLESLHRFLVAQSRQFGVGVTHVTGYRVVESAKVVEVVEKLFHPYS
jgi:hypothetical protein